jgi:hypothetical protein
MHSEKRIYSGYAARMPIQDSPVLLETSGTDPFLNHTPESGRLSKRASFYQSKKTAYQKMKSPVHFSRPPIPLVVVPGMSHQWRRSEEIAEDLDSAPSDDENDVDYVDETERDDASESLRPLKRCRTNSDDASSGALTQTSPKSSLPHTEAIPVRGVLNLHTGGSYSLQLSQAYSPSPSTQAESVNPHQRKDPPTRPRYLPEEDRFLVELKTQNLKWNEIEDLYAKRFSPRKRSLLQGRYYKLKQLAKQRRKGRA